jgi:hypothetical protein
LGEFEGILLFLAHESNYGNANHQYSFRRAILFASHPQRLFYTPRGAPEAIYQDRIIAGAVRMAGEDIPITGDYHQNRRFRPFTSKTSFLAETILRRPPSNVLDRGLRNNCGAAELSVTESVEDANWNYLSNQKPHSYQTMLQLLPKALECLGGTVEEWNHPSEFPEPILRWFKGQKHILFYDCQDPNSTDMLSVYHRISPSDVSHEREFLSLRDMAYGILKAQHNYPEPPDRHLRDHKHLWYSRYGLQEIETCCAACGLISRKDNWPK